MLEKESWIKGHSLFRQCPTCHIYISQDNYFKQLCKTRQKRGNKMEKYAINISNTWSIENLKNIDKNIIVDKIEIELPFGQYEFYEGKINWILDPLPLYDFNIDTCREIAPFNKKASFKVLLLKSKWKEVDSFEGTFIEALEYIKKEFTDGTKAKLQNLSA